MLKTVSSVTNALGALVYQGTWDASANNPTLTSGSGITGGYYVVSVAGTTTLDGISTWSVGDWAVFNGSVWQKVNGSTSESFVNLTVTGTANLATANVSSQLNLTNASNWNVYASGAGFNYLKANLQIGGTANTTTLTENGLSVLSTVGDSTAAQGVFSNVTFSSSQTTLGIGFQSNPITSAASYTLSSIRHFSAQTTTIGSGSTVTNQYGLYVASTMNTATNNYGVYSNLSSATGSWNIFAAGSASNYFGGALNVGTTALSTQTQIIFSGTAPQSSGIAYFIVTNPTFTSSTTSAGQLFRSGLVTQAASFTMGQYNAYLCSASSIGSGSSVTSSYGFQVASAFAQTGMTNVYAFNGALAAGTGIYNLYMNGTADNYLAGLLKVAAATATPAGGSTSAYISLGSSLIGIYFGSGAPTISAAQGSIYLRTDGSSTSTRMYVNTNGSTTWTNFTTAA